MNRNAHHFLMAVLLTFSLCCIGRAQVMPDTYKVTNTFKIGLDGRWDYATLDEKGQLLYLPRTTHTIVVDTATGKVVADFSKTGGAHGVALAPEFGRGFISDGKAGAVIMFDLKTYEILATIPAVADADGIIYDPASRHVFVGCGDASAIVPIPADIDPKSGKADPAIDLGGHPEFIASDGQGMIYANINDKNMVAQIDAKTMKILAKWPTAPGEKPTALAIAPTDGRLFIGCRNQKLIIMSTKDGSILADLPIGRGVDATAFCDNWIFASCADGTLAIVRETSPGKFEVVQTVITAPGAKTMAVDRRTATIYLPTADFEPNSGKGRPKALPDTFKVIVVAQSK